MSPFDESCMKFTGALAQAANWKHDYFGAAYTTRLKQAIRVTRDACDRLEKELMEQGEIKG
jgi:hypothetical protein